MPPIRVWSGLAADGDHYQNALNGAVVRLEGHNNSYIYTWRLENLPLFVVIRSCARHVSYTCHSSTDYNVHYDSYSKFLLNLKSFQILHNNNGVIEVVDRIK